jgi:hypothetical protein
MPRVAHELKVADEVWIATALLHRERPRQADFSVREIQDRVKQEGLTGTVRPGVHVHVISHCVANRPPKPATYRMLIETARGRRRLYRPGDTHHPERRGRVRPDPEDVPPRYRELIDWYETDYSTKARGRSDRDPLLALRGSGRTLWSKEHADDYVKRLREGWA